jgi:hypothetical protein
MPDLLTQKSLGELGALVMVGAQRTYSTCQRDAE